MSNQNIGTVTQIIGPVLDIKFPDGHLPGLLNAITVENGADTITLEVAQHIGDDVVRCIAMSSTDGLVRGAKAVDTGSPITVPVGDQCLGRIFNLLGDPVDNLPAPEAQERRPIHRRPLMTNRNPPPRFWKQASRSWTSSPPTPRAARSACSAARAWERPC